MASEEREQDAPKGLALQYVPLKDAISQVMNLQAMLNSMRGRRDSLAEQLNATHAEDLRAALAEEQDALRRSVLRITERLEAALDIFDESTISVNGVEFKVLDVIKKMQQLFQQSKAFEAILREMKVNDCGLPDLKFAAEQLRKDIMYCKGLWEDQFVGLRIAVEAVMVNESDVLDLQVAFDEIENHIEVKWTGEKWEPTRSIELPHSSIHDFISRMTQAMSERTCEIGTIVRVKVVQTKKQMKISCDITEKTRPIQKQGGWLHVSGTDSTTTTAW